MNNDDPVVFLVDDDEGIRKALPIALRKRGYKVEVFASAAEVLDVFPNEKTGCFVLDLSLPQMDGLELQNELINRGVPNPVIFISGNGSIPQTVQALKSGAIDFLEKPFRQEVLIKRIDEAFSKDFDRRRENSAGKEIRSRFDRLTKREREVMWLLVSGRANLSNKDIGKELGISHRTVDHHRANVMGKMSVKSVTELANVVRTADLAPE